MVRGEARRLEDGESVDTVSADCRAAGLAFLEGVSRGWDRRDFGAWLRGPYAGATRHVRGPSPTAPLSNGGVGRDAVTDDQLQAILSNAKMHTLALLEELALPDGESDYVDAAIQSGALVQGEDELATPVWLPVDVPRMFLRDRLRALFVADYLMSPDDYVRELFVCDRCERVVFDVDDKRLRAGCNLHRTTSDVFIKVAHVWQRTQQKKGGDRR